MGMRKLNWEDPGRQLPKETLTLAARRLGVQFPDDYIEMVSMHAGASSPEESFFDMSCGEARFSTGFVELLDPEPESRRGFFACLDYVDGGFPPGIISVVFSGSNE